MKINITRTDAIQKALNEKQARARARLAYAIDVKFACDAVTAKLDITKKAMNKVRFTTDPNAQHFSSTYTIGINTPMSTCFTCEFSNGSWYLVDVQRTYCKAPTLKYDVKLTDDAKNAIIARCETFA